MAAAAVVCRCCYKQIPLFAPNVGFYCRLQPFPPPPLGESWKIALVQYVPICLCCRILVWKDNSKGLEFPQEEWPSRLDEETIWNTCDMKLLKQTRLDERFYLLPHWYKNCDLSLMRLLEQLFSLGSPPHGPVETRLNGSSCCIEIERGIGYVKVLHMTCNTDQATAIASQLLTLCQIENQALRISSSTRDEGAFPVWIRAFCPLHDHPCLNPFEV